MSAASWTTSGTSSTPKMILEYNKSDEAAIYRAQLSREERPYTTWTFQEAHVRMGHLYEEAVRHLPDACADIKKVEGPHDPYCQICRESDAKQQISRHPPIRAHILDQSGLQMENKTRLNC